MSFKFFGGVHPAENKAATEHKAIVNLPAAPQQVVLPMSMHVGAPCKPVVAKGDQVKVGQLIGEPTGLGAPIHASVSGVVAAVEPRPTVGGNDVMSVVIDNDGLDTFESTLTPHENADTLSAEEILDIIGQAGIVGMGGAGFPTKVKLAGAVGKVDTLLINAAECEPYITADHRLMLEKSAGIVKGVQLIMKVLGLSTAVIGIEDNKMDAVAEMQKACEGTGISVVAMKTKYPQGAEKQLIQRITGRQVPPGKLPADVQCVVNNVASAYAVYEAVILGRPMTHRICTVTGGAVADPQNFYVPIGTSFRHLIEQAGGFKVEPDWVLNGGPMMGIAQFNLDVPLPKGGNAVTCMTAAEHAVEVKGPTCIRCGKCISVCPMHLQPMFINMYTTARRFEEAESFNPADCIECGSCAYTCPAGIPLLQNIRNCKQVLRTMSMKKEAK